MGSMGSMEPLFLKGCLRKFYAQTYYVNSLRSHWIYVLQQSRAQTTFHGVGVEKCGLETRLVLQLHSTHACQLYQEFYARMAYTWTYIHAQARLGNCTRSTWQPSERIKDFIYACSLCSYSDILSVMYQSAYFSAPYAVTSCFATCAARSGVTPLILRASNNQVLQQVVKLCNFTSRLYQKRSQKVRNPKFSWRACPQTPLVRARRAL